MIQKLKDYASFLVVAVALVFMSALTFGSSKIGEDSGLLIGQISIAFFALFLIKQAVPVLLLSVDYRRNGSYGTYGSRLVDSMRKILGRNMDKRPFGLRAIACIRDAAVIFYLLLAGLVFVPSLYAFAVLLWRVVVEEAVRNAEAAG